MLVVVSFGSEIVCFSTNENVSVIVKDSISVDKQARLLLKATFFLDGACNVRKTQNVLVICDNKQPHTSAF